MSDAPMNLEGWTFRQIADFVGGDTTVSKVWNWRKWSQTQNYEDHRRFPDSIGRHPETHAEIFDPIEIQRWLTLNEKKTSQDDHALAQRLFRIADELRGEFSVRDVESILLAVVTDDFGDLLPQLAKSAKQLRSGFGNLDNDSKRQLLKIIRRSFATRDFEEYSTSETLACLIAALVNVTGNSTVFDPCAGTATLLVACADESDHADSIRLVGCEVNEATARLGRALISLSNTSQASEMRNADSFLFDKSFVGFADAVVADPPMGMQINLSKAHIRSVDPDGGFARVQTIANIDRRDPRFLYDTPRGTAETAWVQIALAALRPTGGRAAVVVAPGFAFSEKTRDLRDAVLRRGHLEAVIELDAGVFGQRTSLIPSVLLFDTVQKRAMSRTHVLFIKIVEKSKTNDQNSRMSMTFEKAIGVVRKSRLGKTSRDDSSYVEEHETKTGSVSWRWVPVDEIVARDFSLRSSVYLTKEVYDDLPELDREIARLKQRLSTIAKDINLAAESIGDSAVESLVDAIEAAKAEDQQMSYVELSEVADVTRGVLRTSKSESIYRLRPSDVASGRAPERGELVSSDQVTAQSGDIAINLAYQPGAAMLITNEMSGIAPTDGIALVRPKNHARLHRDFLTQWLLAGDPIRQLKKSVLGSHMIYVKVSAVQKIQIPVPPLEEQLQLIDGCKSADEWRGLLQSLFNDASKSLDLERRKLNSILRSRLWPTLTQGENA